MYTVVGTENSGCVYYFRNGALWKCILFSERKTLEVYTIVGTEDTGRISVEEKYKYETQIIASTIPEQIFVEKYSVMLFERITFCLQFQILAESKRADQAPRVCQNSAWLSRSKH